MIKAEQDSNILALIMFRPYGPSLMTPGTRLWLTTTWVMALFIAAVEAWVVATLMLQLNANAWMVVFAAVAVFAAMFLIDASFVLLDTSATAPTFEGRRTKWGQHLRLLLAAGVRAALFLTTLLVTIPVASLALLDDELRVEQQLSYETKVAEAQLAEEQRLRADVQAQEQRLERTRQRWTDEVNAAEVDGVSGKLGVGARARKYERDQRLLERDLQRAQERLHAYRAHMSALSAEQRGFELGVSPAELTFATRAATLQQIAGRPGVKQKTLLVKVYLLMAFGAVVLLKLLSPTAVRTYLSEELQEARRRAQGHGYDGLLRYGPEGVVPADLGPVDFRHWYFHVLPELRQRRDAIAQVYESRASLEAHRGALEYAIAATRTVAEREESAREELALAQVDVYHLEDEVVDEERRTGGRWRTRGEPDGQDAPALEGSSPARGRARLANAALAGKLAAAEQRLSARQADLDRIQHRRAIAERREEVLLNRVNEREESHLQQVTDAAKGLGAHATFDPSLLLPATLGVAKDELPAREVQASHARSLPLLSADGQEPMQQQAAPRSGDERPEEEDDEPVTLVLSREEASVSPAARGLARDVFVQQPTARAPDVTAQPEADVHERTTRVPDSSVSTEEAYSALFRERAIARGSAERGRAAPELDGDSPSEPTIEIGGDELMPYEPPREQERRALAGGRVPAPGGPDRTSGAPRPAQPSELWYERADDAPAIGTADASTPEEPVQHVNAAAHDPKADDEDAGQGRQDGTTRPFRPAGPAQRGQAPAFSRERSHPLVADGAAEAEPRTHVRRRPGELDPAATPVVTRSGSEGGERGSSS